MSRIINTDQRYKLAATSDGFVPEGAFYIAFYCDGVGCEIDDEIVPEGGFNMPMLPDFHYPAIEYKPNGNTIYIRAFYPSPFQP